MCQIKSSSFLKKLAIKNSQKPVKRGEVFEKTEQFLMKPSGFSIKPSDFLVFMIFTPFYTLTNFVGCVVSSF
jgi:hypothetical protein